MKKTVEKQSSSTLFAELLSIFAVVVATNLVVAVFRLPGNEIRRYTKHASFVPRREGCVGDAPRWDDFYSMPVIGILTDPQRELRNGKIAETLPVSIVRMMQATGAQVIPISYSLPEDRLGTMIKSVNGILIPGTSNNSQELRGDQTKQRKYAVATMTKWMGRDSTPVLEITTDATCQAIEGTTYTNRISSNNEYCNHIVKHKDIPYYRAHKLSFHQENANHFVSHEASKNRNSFESSVTFHMNNIENFPIFLDDELGSMYVVEGVEL